MSSLDHKIPPPVIALLCAALAWLLARITPTFALILPARIPIIIVLVVIGVSLSLSGMRAFRSADTTVNPLAPEQASSIVRSGPYRFTRNPMYLGLALVLLGICAYFAHPLSVLAVVVFVAYITRFQIIPEERLLLEKFGEPYARYKRSVRRWL